MSSGETTGWEILSAMAPGDVCTKAGVTFDNGLDCYTLMSFGLDVSVSIRDRNILCADRGHDELLRKAWEFAGLTYLWYMVNAKDIAATGELVRPDNLKGGHLFSKGTHVLPLNELAEKYNDDIEGFYLRGESLNAEKHSYGDAAIQLMPVPKIPVTLILWRGDDEFPPRAGLLFDSTSEFQVPIDILWSIAMMSVLIMM